jgi:hypothetical protein
MQIMNVGFINIYPWRPHGFHAAFLAELFRELGYSINVLECGGSLNDCYSKINQSGGLSRCVACRLGSVSKYGRSDVHKIRAHMSSNVLSLAESNNGLISSAVSLHRDEIEALYFTNEKIANTMGRLRKNYLDAYYSTLDLIEKRDLTAIVVFNGRIDMTRAAIEAARFAKIKFITHERPFMGHGIQLHVNENVQGLKDRVAINAEYDQKCLTGSQARLAGAEIAKRFLGKNMLEWRRYNVGSAELPEWPTKTTKDKILIIPSSRSETGSHEEWRTPWDSSTDGLQLFLDSIGAEKEQVVVRFHPNWIQKVGTSIGESSRNFYKNWCESNGYYYIDSDMSVSTMSLIADCDITILNGGSAAIEAGALGKKIVNLGTSPYKGASFCCFLESRESIKNFSGFDDWIDKKTVISRTLRYVYSALARFPQYFDYMRAQQSTDYIAYKGADPGRLSAMLNSGIVTADDDSFGLPGDEDEVVDLVAARIWGRLLEISPEFQTSFTGKLNIQKVIPFNYLDMARKYIARGDLR